MATYVMLLEFCRSDEEFSAYLEQVELFFSANDVPDEKQVPIFLSALGRTTYGLLCSLLAPTNPKEQSFAELVTMLK